MKLSEAMELGGARYPLVVEEFCSLDELGNIVGVCALGAACASCATDDRLKSIRGYESVPTILKECGIDVDLSQVVTHPMVRTTEWCDWELGETIIDLVDDRNWSLIRIINWLKGLGL